MNLTLEIVSPHGQALGAARRRIFGPEGGRIGRSPDCDWVLASPYISRHHATIRWVSGTYYIESAGENGVAIGSPSDRIPRLERRPLRSGDRVYIDEFEIVVTLEPDGGEAVPFPSVRPEIGFAPVDDPFADIGPARSARAPTGALEPSNDELDPLKQLGGRAAPPPAVATPRGPASWNHTPGVSDHFAVPQVSAPAQVIPDDWDKTSFSRPPVPRAAPAVLPSAREPAAPPTAAPAAGALRGPSLSVPERPQPERPQPVPEAPSAGRPRPGADAGSGTALHGFDVEEFLRSAGVDPANIAPETAGALGQIIRSVVQGVVDVLRARAEIKEQFRLSQTLVKTAENNPLKFAVNAEDAVASLFGRRNPAYLPPVEAFEDAFDDIRFHQLAMLAGMRAGFDQVMSRFDPQQLRETFDKRNKRGGLLSMSAKGRYWDLFTEEFEELAGDREKAFRRLFAEEFALAYEKQLQALKSSESKPRR